jgi:hypothetical protein
MMGLRSGGCSLAAVRFCGYGAVLEVPLDGGGDQSAKRRWRWQWPHGRSGLRGVMTGFPCTHPQC